MRLKRKSGSRPCRATKACKHFSKTALLRYNSHTIQCTHLKCGIQWFLIYWHECVSITTVIFKTFHHPQENLSPHHHLKKSKQKRNPITFSQYSLSFPPLPSLALFCLYKFSYSGFSYEWNHIVCGLCGWLLSLSILFPRFIHVVVCLSTSFLFIAECYSIIWICHLLLIHLSIDGYLSCFHVLVTMNSAAINTSAWVLAWSYFYFSFILLLTFLGVQLLAHVITLCLIIWGTARLFSKLAASFTAVYTGSSVSTPLPTHTVIWLFWF